MYKEGELISFLDLLDLDEEVIDQRAKSLMQRGSLTVRHFKHFIYFLQYKHLINVQENTECENDEEFNFLTKLIVDVNNENANVTCTIITLVLTLNPSSIINKSEHLLQQILSSIELPCVKRNIDDGDASKETENTLLNLKICGSILDAVKKIGIKISLPFLILPLEQIICTENKQLQGFFLMDTVPKFFDTISDYNILDRIWSFVKKLNDSTIALKVLCSLSNYYLPIVEDKIDILIESTIIMDAEFWDYILSGLFCNEQCLSLRKQAIYLAKRAVDYAVYRKKDIKINSHSTFEWSNKNEKLLKKMWQDYFILIDSLEEKQSNIVLPSLKLLNVINDIGHCWLVAAFNIGLKHDNFQVRQKCLNYRFQFRICNEIEAIAILDALNDSSIFNNRTNNSVIGQLNDALTNVETLINFLQAMTVVKLSPVPLYSLTSCLAQLKISLKNSDQYMVYNNLGKILKTPCNNIVIRKAVYINISHFIANCCKHLYWKEYLSIYPLLDNEYDKANAFISFIQDMSAPEDEIKHFVNTIKSSHINIPFALTYFRGHDNAVFLAEIHNMIDKVMDISNRQYSRKLDCLDDAIFISHLYNYQENNTIIQNINISEAFQAIMQYIMSLLSDENNLDIDEMNLLLEGFEYIIHGVNIVNYKEKLIQLYKSAEILMNDSNCDLQKKLLALLTLNALLKTKFREICNEVKDFKAFVNIINIDLSGHKKEDSGRLRNSFYEKMCELLYTVYTNGNIKDMIYFIDTVVECGGHGCLKWLLKITNKIISDILDQDHVKFDLAQFLNRMWKEIEDLKSNSQYSICMEQFINLLTQDAVLKRPIYNNNVVISYCNKIINYATLKYSPLYFLVRRLNLIDISSYRHIIYILSEILLYANVPSKELRIAENLEVTILERPEFYGIDEEWVQFNSHIQYLAVSVLAKIRDVEILNTFVRSVRRRIDEVLKNKLRYHENSYIERSIEAGLQCLLFIVQKSREVDFKDSALWCMELLGRLPHQPYVRICLEWYISLYFYLEKHVICEEILQQLKSRNVPIQSQFIILYWMLIRKIKISTCLQSEFNYVLEFLTSNSMGPIYGVRLHAQYLATRIVHINDKENKLDDKEYAYIIKVIKNCLCQAEELKEKSFIKLTNSFTQSFDIIENMNFYSIYYYLPVLSTPTRNIDVTNSFLQKSAKDIHESIKLDLKDEFLNEWRDIMLIRKIDCEVLTEANDEATEIIQKKYVPWKSMSNVDVNSGNRRPSSDLVLVASLIDKLPNLGGMARTGEVFGIHTYIMDSFRHIQNRMFQDLSVSAERWLNVEEVRPGEPLKQYLMMKKSEGYTVVAAEQTSNSVKLQEFKFPKKTLLLLGHEKEGISCELLPLCDVCVEVPQRGVVRSLNVHVTAAIFVWEYTRQHVV